MEESWQQDSQNSRVPEELDAAEALVMETNRDIKERCGVHSCRESFGSLCFKGWGGWWEELILSDQNWGLQVTASESLGNERKSRGPDLLY